MKQSIISTANSTSDLPITSTQPADAHLQYSQDVQSNEKTNIFKSLGASAVRRTKAIINSIKNAPNAIIKRFLNLINRIMGQTPSHTMDQTPLIDAIRQQDLEAVDALMKSSATNFNESDKFRGTPLMCAAFYENYTIIDALKGKGVDANAQDFLGNTALIWAVESSVNNSECVKRLLTMKDIDASIKNNKGKTALDYAEANKNEECIKLLRDLIALKNLNSTSAPVANKNDQTSLAEAVEKESVQS